ncbi:MAG: 2-C-methyl-D-erythritol 4-phosphate cytidylyltransferase [Pseudomonadota bacterium]
MAFFHVIIPAAGVGSRMANVLPKQYIALGGKPMISHSIQVFFNHPRIAAIHVALNPEDDFWRSLSLEPQSRLHLHYTGGNTRAETVLNTLHAIAPQLNTDDWILVHDAARPGLTHVLLNRLIDALENDDVGGLLALPVADTLKKSAIHNQVEKTISRADLWQAQTPQMFRFSTLKNALSRFGDNVTDEAEAIEALGLKPKLVQGELRNLKVTYPQDLILLEALFKQEKA